MAQGEGLSAVYFFSSVAPGLPAAAAAVAGVGVAGMGLGAGVCGRIAQMVLGAASREMTTAQQLRCP